MDPNKTLNNLKRLVTLDTSVFDEVKNDPQELIPSLIVLVVSVLIAGIGAWLFLMISPIQYFDSSSLDVDFGNVFVNIWLLGTVFTVALWLAWVAVVYVVLVQFYKETADFQTLLRTMGYASFPFAFTLLMLIPSLGFAFGLAGLVGWFVMSTYAIHATTTATSEKVIMANAAGFLVFALIMSLLAVQSGMTTGVWVQLFDAMAEGEYFSA